MPCGRVQTHARETAQSCASCASCARSCSCGHVPGAAASSCHHLPSTMLLQIPMYRPMHVNTRLIPRKSEVLQPHLAVAGLPSQGLASVVDTSLRARLAGLCCWCPCARSACRPDMIAANEVKRPGLPAPRSLGRSLFSDFLIKSFVLLTAVCRRVEGGHLRPQPRHSNRTGAWHSSGLSGCL